MNTLISIVGTTGIGKTALAIQLANRLKTEIISCDSRQFFRGMEIGTAAPSAEELQQVPHHFVGQLDVQDYYSIGQFEVDALQKLEELFKTHDQVVMVGGSMMYEKAVTEGLNDLPEANAENLGKMQEIFENNGYEKLLQELQLKDEKYYNQVDKANPRRIFRALDVIWQTSEKYSDLIAEPKAVRDFEVIRIGISAPREVIYERINQRVDLMMSAGLLDEVRALLPYRHLTALKTVGYTELFRYLDGEWTLDFAVSEIKKNSRRFAKRQLTWYRGENNIHWVDYRHAEEESLSLLSEYV